MAVLLETSLGELTIDLYAEEVPVLAANFLKLCKIKYYNNSIFHSVEKDFIARGGLRWGSTTSCASDLSILSVIKNESPHQFKRIVNGSINPFTRGTYDASSGQLHEVFHPHLRHHRKGIVAMANDKADQIGSVFYITLRDDISYLNDKRSIIGYITEGLEVLDAINEVIIEDRITNKPLKPIRIYHTTILDDPFDDLPGLQVPIESPEVIRDGEIETTGPQDSVEDEIRALEKIAQSEAKSRAVALEILGDIPDAELAPPDNVLFVCKLNPITEADDLEIIFSRFGRILTCDIIRDWKTGDSLQYGFIEFENRGCCEAALFKMEGCLIDDRRIHVDFCQSVSKEWYSYRRFGNRSQTTHQKDNEIGLKFSEKESRSNNKSYNYVFDDRKKERRDGGNPRRYEYPRPTRHVQDERPSYRDRSRDRERSTERHRRLSRGHSRR